VSRKKFPNEYSGLVVLKIIDATFIQIHTGNAHMGNENKDNAVIFKYLNFNQIDEHVENAKGETA
jgi:hypothetical protein